MPEIVKDVVTEVLNEIFEEIFRQEIHNKLIFTISNDFKGLDSLSKIKFNFIKLKDKLFNCKNRCILRRASAACRRILHISAEDVALFHWTNNNNGDLISTNYCEDQLVHEQNMLRHTMNANTIKDAIVRVNISLSSLTLTSTQEMDLLLNINALKLVKIKTDATSSLANIDFLPGGKNGTYKITNDNLYMYLKELLIIFDIYYGK